MKTQAAFLLLAILCSCRERGSTEYLKPENILENLTYSIDTILLDVGDELFVPGAYSSHDLSEDGNTLFLFYEPDKEIHEYDVSNRKLLARHRFETDGPNIIPSYFNYFQALPNGEFFMADVVRSGIYSMDGEVLETFKIRSEYIEGLNLSPSVPLINNLYISPDKKIIVSLPKIFGSPASGLAVIDLESMTGKILDLPALEITNKFQLTYQGEDVRIQAGDFHTIQFIQNLFIIYSGSTSDIYTYDWKNDSLVLHTFPHELVARSKTGEFPTKVNSREHRREVSKQINNQITFDKFYWDDTRHQYFRIGIINEDYTKTYLFTYNEDLILTGETLLKEFYYMPYMEFFHDGKLYDLFVVGENTALVEVTFNF